MAQSRQQRLVLFLMTLAVFVFIVPTAVFSLGFDAGHKNDTTTDLVTPVIDTQQIRVFEVSSTESQVDFLTEVRGIAIKGVYPVKGGMIRLEPVGDELRVYVYLEIDVDNVQIDDLTKMFIRSAMATGDYPIAFFVAQSRDLVPVTEEVINFVLDGELDVHNVANAHSMTVEAQLIGTDMWAIATSELDLAAHEVEFPAIFGSSTIQLTARLFIHEIETADDDPAATLTPEPTAES